MYATFMPQLKTTKQHLKCSTNQSSICVLLPTETGQVYKEQRVVELAKVEFEKALSFFTLLNHSIASQWVSTGLKYICYKLIYSDTKP